MEQTKYLKDILSLEFDEIPQTPLRCEWSMESEACWKVTISADLTEEKPVGDWQLRVRGKFQPTFTYTTHLTPEDDHVVDMHVFRTPVMMLGDAEKVLCVLPVTDGFADPVNRYYMDLDVPRKIMRLGITTTRIGAHVLYHRTGKAVLPKGTFIFSARIMLLTGEADIRDPFRKVLERYWMRQGRFDCSRLPDAGALMRYVEYTYAWAFERWKDVVWQEFDLDGHRVGAPQMIVTTKQSPNWTGPWSQREPVAIWNQAWFSSLRSAQGLYRYARERGRDDLLEKARMTKELALLFPQEDGLFDAVIFTPNVEVEVDGVKCRRSLGWEHKAFGNSDRNPVTSSLEGAPRHILDMSWTALQMLSWYQELEQDRRLLDYARTYAEKLMTMQDEDGFFPAWIDPETGDPLPQLRQSPECAVSVTMLVKLTELTGDGRYQRCALRCMDALVQNVMPESRWEDFETYWSCSRFGIEMLGKKYPRNQCYKQCSLSPFWMAQALLACYRATGERKFLLDGQRCLDEMLMFQSSYQPDDIPVTVVGGFGVMNGDAELNDARQSLFAELIIEYGKTLDMPEYIQRGMAALRASFSMMYCPENPIAKTQWEAVWPFFDERDYGFMMENYGHGGYTHGDGLGIGVFTIYDWGNGAASEAVMRIRAHHPELFPPPTKGCGSIKK